MGTSSLVYRENKRQPEGVVPTQKRSIRLVFGILEIFLSENYAKFLDDF